jgi:hypothetical protein
MSVKYVIENGKEYKVTTLRGQQQWLLNGNVHWTLNGKCHREKGPALLEVAGAKKEDYEWWHREYVKINYFDENIFIVSKWYYINGK